MQDKPQADCTRVGAETNDLLTEGGIGSTVITSSTKEGGKALAQTLSRLQTCNNADKSLQQAYRQIQQIAARVGLNQSVIKTASSYYKLVYEQKGARGRGLAAVAAAVVFKACCATGNARTFRVHAASALPYLRSSMLILYLYGTCTRSYVCLAQICCNI